jgi:formate dehydrogenase beta subunit
VEKVKVYNRNEKIGIPAGRKREELKMLPPESRKWIFDEVEEGFSIPEARREADRCLRCVRIGLAAV